MDGGARLAVVDLVTWAVDGGWMKSAHLVVIDLVTEAVDGSWMGGEIWLWTTCEAVGWRCGDVRWIFCKQYTLENEVFL